jgi:hypothetical protein
MKDEPVAGSEPIQVGWDQILSAVFASLGIKEGLWSVGVGFNFTGLNAGPDRDHILPSALVAVQDIALRRVSAPGPMVFDAKSGKRVDFSDDLGAKAGRLSDASAARKGKAASSTKKRAPRKPAT